jgi:hypothetical protein
VGRLVGKALYDGQLIDAYFTRSFYKHMLGQVGGRARPQHTQQGGWLLRQPRQPGFGRNRARASIRGPPPT